MKKLKNLMVPIIALLLVLISAIVIIFWKEEEEPEDIIQVSGYEGKESEFILENDSLRFVMDAATTQFTVTDKISGQVWYSNPQDAKEDALALNVEKEKLLSTLILTYSTINGVDTLYNNYKYSMEKGLYEIEADSEYIKVHYSIGDIDKEYIIPPVILKADMEAFLAKMSKSDAIMVQDYYRLYDINKLGKKDDREALLLNYPIMESEVIYVLRSGTKENIKRKFETFFEEAGYTIEDYAVHRELDFSVNTSSKPVFNIDMIYKLDGDNLLVEIPMEDIEYKEEYPILYLNVLPYFGAAGTEDEGYIMVPEGGGALIHYNNGKVAQNSYYANVYGWDMAIARKAVVHETRTYFNAFGMARDNAAFLCILEEGAPYASIQADISGRNNSYNFANAIYNVTYREQYDVADKYNGSMYVYQESLPEESLTHRYCFIDSGSYVEMANTYNDYLMNRYEDSFSKKEDSGTPVVIELLGAADKVKQVMGIPISRPLPLTTYSQAEEILEELAGQGIDNMYVKLSGWMNGGVTQKMLNKVKLISELGGKKDFQNLLDTASENNITIYLNGITDYAYESNMWNGFFVYTDAARKVSKEKAELFEYSAVTYDQFNKDHPYYLLKSAIAMEMLQNLSDYAYKAETGVSLEDVGRNLSSDFNRKDIVTRQDTLEKHAAALEKMRSLGQPVMINGGNDYAVAYADMVTNMDLKGSQYTILDQNVPIYQMAIHGYVNYTGEPLNLTQNYEEELLLSASYGAGLSFSFMKETAFVLQNSSYTEYFGADYGAWQDKMTNIYFRYNEELGHTFHQRIIDYGIPADKISCTVYEDGTRVYVNYSYEDYITEDGITVTARDYQVIR